MSDAEAVFREFISAFNELALKRFRACLASDVSLFAPSSSSHVLIEGAEAVEAHFAHVFSVERPAGPNIRPTNVHARQLGEQAALITFEFPREGGSIGRRTLVLHLEAGQWKVGHIHASNTTPHNAAA
jgi:ketosteroid isomerase-like protein